MICLHIVWGFCKCEHSVSQHKSILWLGNGRSFHFLSLFSWHCQEWSYKQLLMGCIPLICWQTDLIGTKFADKWGLSLNFVGNTVLSSTNDMQQMCKQAKCRGVPSTAPSYGYTPRHSALEIKNIIPDPVMHVQTTRSST